MPIVIGIKDAEDKGFSEEERRLTAGFDLGMLCMHAGIGDIGKERRFGHTISVDEAVLRFTMVMEVFNYDHTQPPFKWLTETEFVQRMADSGWSCNVGNTSPEEFHHNLRNAYYSLLMDNVA